MGFPETMYGRQRLNFMTVLEQLPTGDNSPTDKNKAQLLPTRTMIARTTLH